jgi:putative component of toxin-antitoxin plasmid stabilization module
MEFNNIDVYNKYIISFKKLTREYISWEIFNLSGGNYGDFKGSRIKKGLWEKRK